MYYCLPEPNATRVIKITKRNKTLSPITVRRRVEIKFSVESAFLYLVFCNKLVHVCGLTALRHKTTAWTMKPAQHIVVSIFGKSSIHTSWYVCVKQTEKVLFFSLKNGEVRYSGLQWKYRLLKRKIWEVMNNKHLLENQVCSLLSQHMHILTVHDDCSHADSANLLHKLGKAPEKLFNNRGMAISKMRASPLFPSLDLGLNFFCFFILYSIF